MPIIECQCRVICAEQFARAIDMLEKQLTENPDTQRRDANRVFHTAKKIAASDALAQAAEAGEPAHNCAINKKCCGGCLPTVERKLQARGFHTGETLDTGMDTDFMEDICPFPIHPAPSPGG